MELSPLVLVEVKVAQRRGNPRRRMSVQCAFSERILTKEEIVASKVVCPYHRLKHQEAPSQGIHKVTRLYVLWVVDQKGYHGRKSYVGVLIQIKMLKGNYK